MASTKLDEQIALLKQIRDRLGIKDYDKKFKPLNDFKPDIKETTEPNVMEAAKPLIAEIPGLNVLTNEFGKLNRFLQQMFQGMSPVNLVKAIQGQLPSTLQKPLEDVRKSLNVIPLPTQLPKMGERDLIGGVADVAILKDAFKNLAGEGGQSKSKSLFDELIKNVPKTVIGGITWLDAAGALDALQKVGIKLKTIFGDPEFDALPMGKSGPNYDANGQWIPWKNTKSGRRNIWEESPDNPASWVSEKIRDMAYAHGDQFKTFDEATKRQPWMPETVKDALGDTKEGQKRLDEYKELLKQWHDALKGHPAAEQEQAPLSFIADNIQNLNEYLNEKIVKANVVHEPGWKENFNKNTDQLGKFLNPLFKGLAGGWRGIGKGVMGMLPDEWQSNIQGFMTGFKNPISILGTFGYGATQEEYTDEEEKDRIEHPFRNFAKKHWRGGIKAVVRGLGEFDKLRNSKKLAEAAAKAGETAGKVGETLGEGLKDTQAAASQAAGSAGETLGAGLESTEAFAGAGMDAAGTAAGAGGGGGAVVATGAAGAAGGGGGAIIAAAVSNPVTAVIAAVVAALVVIPVVVAGVIMAFEKLGETVAESQRHLAKYNGDMARSFAMYDVQKIFREMRSGENRSATTGYLLQELAALQNALQPILDILMNVFNVVLAEILHQITLVVYALRIVVELGIGNFIQAWDDGKSLLKELVHLNQKPLGPGSVEIALRAAAKGNTQGMRDPRFKYKHYDPKKKMWVT